MNEMAVLAAPILILIALSSIAIGIFLTLNPALAIELQKKFYAKINWRIEPVSMPKEIRNTKLMGLLLIAISLLTIPHLFKKF